MLIKAIKKRLFRRYALKLLEKSEPEKIEKLGKEKLLPAFKRAAERVPAYAKILHEKNINIGQINTLEDFAKKVPILKKEDLFPKFKLKELCIDGNLNELKSAFTSSGFSGVFSYGPVFKDDEENTKEMVDFLLDYTFETSRKKTVIINALAMGVSFQTSLPIISTSVKSEMVIAFIKKLKEDFEQFIIFSSPYFAKKIIEDGIKLGLDWKNYNVNFLIGGEWFPNSLASYLKSMLKKDAKVLSTMGLSEIGLNLFHDSPILSSARDIIQKDEKLRKKIFGNLKTCPEIMYYYPPRYLLEIINKNVDGFGEMVFSILGNNKMPLMRYNSKDIGKIFRHEDFFSAIRKAGYNLNPEFKLPIIAIIGRESSAILGDKMIAQDINEALYKDVLIAKKITGYFRVSGSGIDIQLKENINPSLEIKRKIEKLILDFIGKKISVKVYSYQDFPYGMTLDYESKFRFI